MNQYSLIVKMLSALLSVRIFEPSRLK